MNPLPSDWSDQLQSAYPKRSGPSGWRSTKLMLALRRALFESTWQEIIDGCKNYARYCEQGGKTGSEFVQAPLRFIADGCYLEEFSFQTAQDPKKAEAARNESERLARAVAAGSLLAEPLSPLPRESVAAFETRIYLAQTFIRGKSIGSGAGGSSASGGAARDQRLASGVASLADRMRIAK